MPVFVEISGNADRVDPLLPRETESTLERRAQLCAASCAERRFVSAECHLEMDVGDMEDTVTQVDPFRRAGA